MGFALLVLAGLLVVGVGLSRLIRLERKTPSVQQLLSSDAHAPLDRRFRETKKDEVQPK